MISRLAEFYNNVFIMYGNLCHFLAKSYHQQRQNTALLTENWSLRGREVACSASDRQGSNFESCVWRTVSSQSSHHPQEVLLAQFSLYVHKGGLKPDSFHLTENFWQSIVLLDILDITWRVENFISTLTINL